MPNLDWNGNLHMPQTPMGKPFPDGMFWAVTEEGDVVELCYDHEATFWLGKKDKVAYYSRQDGESGTFSQDDILGWADSYDDAFEAAQMFLEFAA